MNSITFDPSTGRHSFTGPNGKPYSSINKSHIESTFARFYGQDAEKKDYVEAANNEVVEDVISDEEIGENIKTKFAVLDLMTQAAIDGNNRSMIVSGNAGLGKSYSIVQAFKKSDSRHKIIKGFITPRQLFETLWNYKKEGDVLIFDDCDSIFENETSLNLLKAATDTSEERTIDWMTSKDAFSADGSEIPSGFVFEGAIIFITNKDFNKEIEKGTKLSVHFEALRSRSHYLGLGMYTNREKIVRIKQIVQASDEDELVKEEIINFIVDNQNKMTELSLRVVNKITDLITINPFGWKNLAKVTLMK